MNSTLGIFGRVLRGAGLMAVLALSALAVGCRDAAEKPSDAQAVEQLRQREIDMHQREMENR